MKLLLIIAVVLLGCSGSSFEASSGWHCFDSNTDFGCVCEPGEPVEPTGDTCPAALDCCFAYVVNDDLGEPKGEACRCVAEDAKACADIVDANGAVAVGACPGR